MKKSILLLIITTVAASSGLLAQAGKLDSTFGINGYARKNPEPYTTGSFGRASGIVVNPTKGKIILAGVGYDAIYDKVYQTLVGLKADGSVDTYFGINGAVNYQPLNDANSAYFYGIQSIALQPDNKILIAAAYYYSTDTVKIVVSRFNINGTIDGSFGSYGSVYIKYSCYGIVGCNVAIQKNGKIVLASSKYDDNLYQTMVAWRFNSNGTPDLGFNGTGFIDLSDYFPYWDMTFNKMQISPTGKIILGGSGDSHGITYYRNFIMVKLQPNGTPDPTFGSSGIASAAFDTSSGLSCTSIALENDGDIIATGTKTNDQSTRFAFIDFKTNGLLNKAFNNTGKLLLSSKYTGALNDIKVDSDNKIVGCGYQYTYKLYNHAILLRLNRYGTLDSSFGKNGVVTPDSTQTISYGSLAFDTSGKIVCSANTSIASYTVFGAARYFANSTTLNSVNEMTADTKLNTQNIPASFKLNIYPNPVQKDAVLSYSLNADDIISIGLFDMHGKMIKMILDASPKIKGSYSQPFNLPSSLATGTYIVTLSSKTNKTSTTILKQ